MKKFISHPLSLISGLVLVIIFISTSSFAFDVDPDQGMEVIDNPVVLGGQSTAPNPTCADNWANWSRSTEFNPDAEWSLAYFPAKDNQDEQGFKQYTDVNGDGLQDFIYVYKEWQPSNPAYNQTYECLMLNNGHGWDLNYKCVSNTRRRQAPHQNEFEIIYYGDCALLDE